MSELNKVDVLDKGYVRLVDHMGSDLSVVNSARVSYNKEVAELTEKDERLIRFLAKNDHTSPFRHATMQFEVYAPLMVARQWWKYIIGSAHQDSMVAWNESSRRYISDDEEFYMPDVWRGKPENSKQGSGEPMSHGQTVVLANALDDYVSEGKRLYKQAIGIGTAPEQARLFLPAYGMYVRWYWTASLAGVAHFLNQRLEHDAQKEIQLYAEAVNGFATELFPESIKQLVEGGSAE